MFISPNSFVSMQIDIITCHPDLLVSPFSHSIMKRAIEKGLVNIQVHDLRQYGMGKYRQIDDYAFGGGAGMVLMIEPIVNCLEDLQQETQFDEIIYMSPDGESFTQGLANGLATMKNILLLCGHYKGIDERLREHFVTREISIGDYVLSGGELAAAVVTDAIVRLLPGVLSDETSALTDSFQDGLVAPPVYTRPADFRGLKVPDILRSGNQAAIEQWRFDQSVERTKQRRPGFDPEDL
jgi:tRNA (guanine37-N1)-methyltransferase